MKIGVTYDLKSYYLGKGFSAEEVAEFDCEETIDAIADVIVQMGFEVDRIGCLEQLMQRLLNGDRWDLVFNIAEGLYGVGREAQVPALLDAYKIPHTFSSTELLALALDKGMTNAVVKSLGVRVSDFCVVRKPEDIDNVKIEYPLFAKPVAEGTSKGISARSLIKNKTELKEVCIELLNKFNQPVLVEEYLPGREFTVGLLGYGENTRAIGVMEVLLENDADMAGYTYDNKQLYEGRVKYALANEPEVAELAIKAWKALNCLDAGRVDIRINAQGKPTFMEVNPLAGLNPTYSDICIMSKMAGVSHFELISSIIKSAMERNNL